MYPDDDHDDESFVPPIQGKLTPLELLTLILLAVSWIILISYYVLTA